ncbi:hypothetical protein [Tsuneonella sp. HG222]
MQNWNTLLGQGEFISVCRIFDFFPDEESIAEFFFQIRGGPTFSCKRCKSPGIWQLTPRPFLRSCGRCGLELDIMAGTWLSRINLHPQSWIYLLAIYANREPPLSLRFLADHFAISKSKAWEALTLLRNRIALIRTLEYEPSDYRECYVDEFLFYYGRRWRRNPTLGTFILGLSSASGIQVKPSQPGRMHYAKLLAGLQLQDAILTTSNLPLWESLTRDGRISVRLAEWEMGSQNGALVEARARLNAFWPYFKRNARRGRFTHRGEHLERYLNEYAFRYSEKGRGIRIFGKLLGVIERFR